MEDVAIPLPFNIGGSVFSTPENISRNLLSKAHFFPLTGIFVFAPAAQDRANHRRIYFGDQLIYPPLWGQYPKGRIGMIRIVSVTAMLDS